MRFVCDVIEIAPTDGWRCFRPGRRKAYLGPIRVPYALARRIARRKAA